VAPPHKSTSTQEQRKRKLQETNQEAQSSRKDKQSKRKKTPCKEEAGAGEKAPWGVLGAAARKFSKLATWKELGEQGDPCHTNGISEELKLKQRVMLQHVDSGVWYLSEVVGLTRNGGVHLKYAGWDDETEWLPVKSTRIRPNVGGKSDWRHLGNGAWEFVGGD